MITQATYPDFDMDFIAQFPIESMTPEQIRELMKIVPVKPSTAPATITISYSTI